jgi:general secretion pathway protein D
MRLRALCLVLFLGLCARPAVALPLVSVQPALGVVGPGDSFFLDINISSVQDLFGFQFDLLYDPSVLTANAIVEGSFLASAGDTFFLPGTIDNIAGTVALTANALIGMIPGATGGGTLARLNFTAKSTGTSIVDLSNLLLVGVMADSSLSEIPGTTQGTTVTVASTVPEPGSVVLVGTGLVAAWRSRRRFARAA